MFNPDRPADDPVFCKGFSEGYRIGARDALNGIGVRGITDVSPVPEPPDAHFLTFADDPSRPGYVRQCYNPYGLVAFYTGKF